MFQQLIKGRISRLETSFATRVLSLPLDKAAEMVLSGEITDSKTVAAVLKVKALRDAGRF